MPEQPELRDSVLQPQDQCFSQRLAPGFRIVIITVLEGHIACDKQQRNAASTAKL